MPGLFQGVVDGVQSAAKYLNSKEGGGGIGGRKLVVDFIDSKLNGNAARDGVITACQNDFAMVGTAALFLPTVEDQINCTDKAGAATGLPDIGAVVTGVAESCSPVSFPVNPPQLVCSTKDQSEQTYYGNQGDSKYLLKKHKNDLHGSMLSGQRHQGRPAGWSGADRHRDRRRDQGGSERRQVGSRSAERVHARSSTR